MKGSSSLSTTPLNHEENNPNQDEVAKYVEQLKLTLPKEVGFLSPNVYFYQNFWCPCTQLQGVVSFQRHFQAHDSDIFLASKPKSGTTWLKALAFVIAKRETYPIRSANPSDPHPLLTANPHELMPFLVMLYSKGTPDLSMCSPPRLFSAHLPYPSLPESIKSSKCRIVYLCRNPFDTVVSFLKFKQTIDKQMKQEHKPLELDEYIDYFCRGIEGFGPHWDNILGYWEESLKNPNKVLFMKYEDIKLNERAEIKRLAEFMGFPFTPEEEASGVIDEISNLCSFQNMKELEANKRDSSYKPVSNEIFFRQGKIGDWKNHISPSSFERLNKVMEEKFDGTGLTFKFSP